MNTMWKGNLMSSPWVQKTAIACDPISPVLHADCVDKCVAIVIVNWNGWRDTVDCLDTLLTQDYSNYIVLVVDNDSQDGSVERIAEWCNRPYRAQGGDNLPGVRRLSDAVNPGRVSQQIHVVGPRLELGADCQVVIIRSGGNLGFAGGCNLGACFADERRCHYLWFLNSDTVVRESALTEMMRVASSGRSDGMVGSTLLYYRRPTVVQALGGADLILPGCVIKHRGEGDEHFDAAGSTDIAEQALTYIVGASMLVPMSLLNTIGLMQDDYFLYYEEIDWAFRSRGRYRQIYAPLSVVYHKAGASSKDKVSEFSRRLLLSNKLIFFSRYLSYMRLPLRFQMFGELLRDILRRRWRTAGILAGVLARGNMTSVKSILRVG
jgi:GT2 family glycosyltransferase